MAASNATPMMALDAVILDIETTGLDPAKARVLEIGAVRLIRGRLDPSASFRHLVRPDTPVPADTVRIHGIDEAILSDARPFAEVWPELADFVGDAVVIGQSIGFDLAVLKRECERAGLAWVPPHTLDTRLLAEVAEPELADYSLDAVAAWLGVEVTDRHSALGDALITARVFGALVPKLREGRIRTLGEAAQACRTLTAVLDRQHRAGWVESAVTPSRVDAEQTLSRIDSYPYRHRIRDVMRAPAQFLAEDATLDCAVRQMVAEQISSLFVRPTAASASTRAQDTGIITERDVLRALAQRGGPALSMPISRFMNKPLEVVPADAFVYRAVSRMSQLKTRHLGVVDESGDLVGAVSARDLLRLRAGEAVLLGEEIDAVSDAHGLAAVWTKLPHIAALLTAEGVPARDVAEVISRELGALTGRAGLIAQRRMIAEGHGDPPCPYAIAILGSAGRGESLLAMDQDNALVFAEGAPGGSADLWFERFGVIFTDILHQAGVPYCPGGVMARNAQWRGSTATWRERIGHWIASSRSEALLAVDIFFDMRPVQGDGRLCTVLRQEAFDAARKQTGFAKLLIEAAGTMESGFGFFHQFKTTHGRLDAKKTGLFAIVTMARALAIRHHVVEHSTPARLSGLKQLQIGGGADLESLIDAHGTLLDLVLAQQIEDLEHGIPPTNRVAIKSLSRRDRERLRTALKAVEHLDALSRDLLFAS